MLLRDDSRASPFIIGKMITDPARFWGRKRECQDIFTRLQKMESSSITGPRRIGKSSLAYYIYKQGPKQLGEAYEFVWLDGQSNHSASANHFFGAIAGSSSLAYRSADNLTDCLINFEDAVKAHPKKLVVIINEFEILTDENHHFEFGKSFYDTLRLLAEQGCCALIITSCASLKELCKHVLGVSSPFYNVFEQITLKHFTTEEADSFLVHNHDGVIMAPSEIQLIQTKVAFYQHPLVLQIACDSILENRESNLPEADLLKQIEERVSHFLAHEKVQEGRRMKRETAGNSKDSHKLSKPTDMLISVLIPVLGIGLLMLEYGLLIRALSNLQAVLLALVTAILGFAILIFVGRSVDIIGESAFYKLFSQIIKQIPLLSNVADTIAQVATKLQGK